MKTPNTTGASEASAKTPTEQREQRQWWTHDEGTVHHLTGYSCGPLNPTYWWCPKIGSSLPESQLFTEESAAKDAAKEACRKRIEQWSQKLVALEAPDLLAENAALREEVAEYRCANIEARQEIIPDLRQGLTTLNEQVKRKDAELARLREEVPPLLESLRVEYDKVKVERDTLRETNAGLVADKERLEFLFNLTDRENEEGSFRATLQYDNYQDGAWVVDGDGNVIGSCHDIDKEPNDQFRVAIDEARAALDAAKGGEA